MKDSMEFMNLYSKHLNKLSIHNKQTVDDDLTGFKSLNCL